MSVQSRTLPLTPAMRFVLTENATGLLRRTLLNVLACLVLFAVVLVPVSLSSWSSVPVAIGMAIGFILAPGGFVFLLMGLLVGARKQANVRALRAGRYTRYEGPFETSRLRTDGAPQHYFHIDGHQLELDQTFPILSTRLPKEMAGTVLFVPDSDYLLAAWDRDGELLYAAPDYDYAGDIEAAHAASGTVPDPRTVPWSRGFAAWWAALVSPLARRPAAVALLGAAMLILGIVMMSVAWNVEF